MAAIRIYSKKPNTCTTIPNLFIENYMPQANGEFVKVFLCLLRSMQSGDCDCSVTAIADLLNHTENDILRAIRYWEKQGLLLIEYNTNGEISGICFSPADAEHPTAEMPVSMTSADTVPFVSAPSVTASGVTAPSVSAPSATAPSPAETQALSEPRQYSSDEINAFSQSPDVQELFFIVTTLIRHPLTDTDTNTVLFWYDELKFSAELIEYLVEYCISKGHSGTRYMNKVAVNWAKDGIASVEEAKENSAIHNKVYYAVMKAMGIHGRNLVKAETDFIAKWTDQYKFSTEMIQEACSRTILATHQPSFDYADSILSKWYRKGILTPEAVGKDDEEFSQKKKSAVNGPGTRTATPTSGSRNKFNNFDQRTYDELELERLLLNTQHS